MGWNQLGIMVHELGHLIHAALAQAPSYSLNGYFRPSDFVEIPSTLFEALILDPDFLQSILSPSAESPLPTVGQLRAGIERRKERDRASYLKPAPFLSRTYQVNGIFLAVLDQALHGLSAEQLEHMDVKEFFRDQWMSFHTFPTSEEDIFPAQFFHPAVGMAGTYYSYLLSGVYVALLRNWFNQQGGLNQPVSMIRYRKSVLEPSLLDSPSSMIEDIIGKDFDLESLVEELF